MARQLVVCLDGTGNRFSHRPTNVVRLFRSLDTDDGSVLAYYDQGVGTFGLKETLFEWQKLPARVAGLAFGWGMKRIVEGAYRFLAEHWREGDEIFIFGFSRGAYAARALAAMLRAAGLVPGHQVHLFDQAWAMLLAREGRDRKPDFKLQARFKASFGRPVRVNFLGLFDTVKSLGWVYDPVIIPYTANNPIVDVVRHAVSIDERRCFFRQHLWGGDGETSTDLEEVWFAGVHSDIGGGYEPESAQLALIACRWMVGEATRHGLRIDAHKCRRQLQPSPQLFADPGADMHDSMTGAWKLAEWVPQRVWSGSGADRIWRIGAMTPLRPARVRPMAEGVALHASVEERIALREDYRPSNLPSSWRVVEDDPALESLLA